mmetsp:Transcript_10644/g.15539  ORF Transcript_10644/g.15539 Transcript_10644/m.15539 type:complete len:117 (-) Transcript_10644:22-372(-)
MLAMLKRWCAADIYCAQKQSYSVTRRKVVQHVLVQHVQDGVALMEWRAVALRLRRVDACVLDGDDDGKGVNSCVNSSNVDYDLLVDDCLRMADVNQLHCDADASKILIVSWIPSAS